MKDEYVRKFYKEVNQVLEGDYKIILESQRELNEDWIEYDTVKWELEEPMIDLIKSLKKNETLSFEEKVLKVYNFICMNYIYDDNVLFFFRKDNSDLDNIKYVACDWYGRVVGNQWIENRKNHNRRICYEFARFYAKAINDLIGGDDSLEAIMLGDKENTHYVVGLTGKKYSAILDLDDFNKIKDLTRIKLGLTLAGISILRDETGILQKTIDKFNEGRLNNLLEVEEVKEKLIRKDSFTTIEYFKAIIEILKKYNLDPQGFMEYMRKIVEDEEIKVDKIWKEIKGDKEKRYVRCLYFDYNNTSYLIDSVEQVTIETKKEDLDKEVFILIPEEHEYEYYGG